MHGRHSPWTHQLPTRRDFPALSAPLRADVVIVGAGIAGISTAYFLLTHTKRSVVLLEAFRIAHGATGHNAGQLAQYFERPFAELVQEFGAELAADALREVQHAFLDVQRIVHEEGLSSRVDVVTGYAGLPDIANVERMARDIFAQKEAGLKTEELLLAKNHPALRSLAPEIRALATWLPQKDILALLETDDQTFIGALAGAKGCMNSALFSEELLLLLLKRYPRRIKMYEHTSVHDIFAGHHSNVLTVADNVKVVAKDVVLCTNGFEHLRLRDEEGRALDRWFHRTVRGSVGYMAGYFEERNLPPAAVSFLSPMQTLGDAFSAEPYMYVTRRPFEVGVGKRMNLVCIGGPETLLDDTTSYHPLHTYPKHAIATITSFLHTTWRRKGKKKTFDFLWHGLMGYTPHGVRLVGRDATHEHLLYNLGCNGVGILTSVLGAKRIARILGGEELPPSIFDPLPERGLKKVHLGEWLFAYTLFALGLVLGLGLGGFLSLQLF